jgi:Sec7-like guanine-nucleotide exchange factor
MIHSEITSDLPDSVASFLKNCDLIESNPLSEYLSQQNNSHILQVFIAVDNFSDLKLDESLYALCQSLKLSPDEKEKIDQIINAFATHYHQQNSSVSEDVLMLFHFQ